MKIIFFGSDDFSAFHLKHLLTLGHEVLCCVTGPDKPQGRGMKIVLSPVKEIALEHGIDCLQPASLKSADIVATLKAYRADMFVVVAYGRLLTQDILDIPKIFCINVHPSLLPKYRGAAPIHWAIINGDKETGVTVQKMALAMDAGDILMQKIMSVGDDDNAVQLRERMVHVGAELLAKVLEQCALGQQVLTPQDETKVSYASKLTREMGNIDWQQPAQVIVNQVRGLKPWPGAYTFYRGKLLKVIHATMSVQDTAQYAPGQVSIVDRNGFSVATGQGSLLIKEVQPEDGRVMSAVSFAAGYKIVPGCQLNP